MEAVINVICLLLGIAGLIIWLRWPCDLTAGTMSGGHYD